MKASCFGGPCDVRVSGAVVAGAKRFAIRPRERSIGPSEIHRIRAEATGVDGSTDTAKTEVKIRERRRLG